MTESRSGAAGESRAAFEALAARIDYPDAPAAQTVRDHWQAAESRPLGQLERLAAWWAGAQGRSAAPEPRRPRLLLLADTSERERIAAVTDGADPVCALADLAAVAVRAVELDGRPDVDYGSGQPAVWRALEAGVTLADAEVDAGTDLLALGTLGSGDPIAAAAVISVSMGIEPVRVVERRLTDAEWARRCVAVRTIRRRARPDRDDIPALLATVGAVEIATLVGLLLGAAARRTPVLLDGGPVCATAALAASAVAPRITGWTLVGHGSADPAARAVLDRLALSPVMDVGLSDGGGLGAMVAMPVLRAAARVTERAMARTAG